MMLPVLRKAHSFNFSASFIFSSSGIVMKHASTIMLKLTRQDANTGPTHGTGIKKRMSQVNKDSGQFKNSFKNT